MKMQQTPKLKSDWNAQSQMFDEILINTILVPGSTVAHGHATSVFAVVHAEASPVAIQSSPKRSI